MQECQQGVNPIYWEASLVSTMLQCIQSSFQFVYVTSNGTKCSIEKRTNPWPGQWSNITYIKEDNLPLLWYLENVKFCWNQKHKDSVIPLKLRKSSVCEIFCTHTYTLRLVSPLGCPGNSAYPTAQRGYPMAREHTLLPNTLPSTQQTIIQPREAALQPTDFRRLPYGPEATLRPGDYPYSLPAYPSFRNRHTHGTQHTQSSRKAPGATQTTRLHSQPTESITNNAQRRQIQRIQRKA